VKKKYVGRGKSSEAFELSRGKILKLFRDREGAKEKLEREVEKNRLLKKTDLPMPRIRKIVQLGNRGGIIFDNYSKGTPLDIFLKQRPWSLIHSAYRFAHLHAMVHNHQVSELPSQREEIIKTIRAASKIPTRLKKAALEALDGLPDGDILCHGDFHCGNVIFSPRGALIIDWSTA